MDSQAETDESAWSAQRNRTRASTHSAEATSNQRARARGATIVIACNECRKKRAKCDGERPCRRCNAHGNVQCIYEIPIRQSKNDLRKELKTLREQQYKNETVFAGLNNPKVQGEVLSRLQAGELIESIATWLDAASKRQNNILDVSVENMDANTLTHPLRSSIQEYQVDLPMVENADRSSAFHLDQPRWETRLSQNETLQDLSELPEPARSRVTTWAEIQHASHIADNTDKAGGINQAILAGVDPLLQQATETWTSVTDDVGLVKHLLGLYFCWEYPTFASLSKEQFLGDFRDGRTRYCSPLLVNALLALGCRYSSMSMTESDPEDPYSSGEHFFEMSLQLLRQEPDRRSLPTIQALGVLSLREASCGRMAEGMAFSEQSMRLAVEMGLHNLAVPSEGGDKDDFRVRSATFWGAFSLDHAWSLATYSSPCFSKSQIRLPKLAIVPDIEASLWLPYTDSGTPSNSFHGQPSNVHSVFKCFIELSELTHQILYLLRSPEDPFTAKRLMDIYTNYVTWFDHVPEVLKLGYNFTPAVLFSHMYYHFGILLLFRPFICLRIMGSEIIPRDVCLKAARAIHTLLKCYTQLYTLKRTPTFLPHFVFISSVTLFAIGILTAHRSADSSRLIIDAGIAHDIQLGMDALAEITPCHHVAEQAVHILRNLAKKWNIYMEIDSQTVVDQSSYEKFVEPYSKKPSLFGVERLAQRLIVGGDNLNSSEEGSRPVEDATDMLEKLMLWPMPLQESLLSLSETSLAERGFFKM